MKILIVGNSGRAHAFAWKLAQSTFVTQIFVTPGNPGTALEPKTQNVNIDMTDIPKLIDFARKNQVNLTFIAHETPLAMGIVDEFKKCNLPIIGPTKEATTFETSKGFCKEFLKRHNIPCPPFEIFNDANSAKKYVKQKSFPIVIKADGLAHHGGVVIAQDLKTANDAIDNMFKGKLTKDNHQIEIEEFVKGEEISYLVMIDGENILPFSSVRDHKLLLDNEKGPITSGMGAYSPSALMSPELDDKVMRKIIVPTLKGFIAEKIHYQGFLYVGLMITPDGEPTVLEFNCRLGDAMAIAVLMRLNDDLYRLLLATVEKRLAEIITQWDARPAVCVVMTSEGYPYDTPIDEPITGLPKVSLPELKVFQAGTKLGEDGELLTASGKVLSVGAMGETFLEAKNRAYDLVKLIKWEHQYYRTDIAQRAVERKG